MFSVGVILVVLAVSAVQEPAAAQPPTIVTRGDGIVRRAPDVAFVTVGVEARARSPRDAQRQAAEQMTAVTKRFTDLGIPRDALRTVDVRLEQEFDNANGRRVPRGFLARNTVEVRVDDVNRAGEIADAAVQSGATTIDGIRFDVKDRTAAEREALRIAVAEARAKADAAAAGAGRAVDRILKIEEEGAIDHPRPFGVRAMEAATVVAPGLIEISASVTLVVAMK